MEPIPLLGVTALVSLLAYAVVSDTVDNKTGSMPLGQYVRLPAVSLHVGDFATACVPPEAVRVVRSAGATLAPGPCAGNAAVVVKVVVGLPGDRFAVTPRGIEINGATIAHSAPLPGFPVPEPKPTTVPAGYAVLWSPVHAALDSRYLGPLPVNAVAFHWPPLDPASRDRLVPRAF